MAAVATTSLFLRWILHHGLFVVSLIAVSVVPTAVITTARKWRLTRALQGINSERTAPTSHPSQQ